MKVVFWEILNSFHSISIHYIFLGFPFGSVV